MVEIDPHKSAATFQKTDSIDHLRLSKEKKALPKAVPDDSARAGRGFGSRVAVDQISDSLVLKRRQIRSTTTVDMNGAEECLAASRSFPAIDAP